MCVGDIPLNNIVLLSFYSFSVRNCNVREKESKPPQVIVLVAALEENLLQVHWLQQLFVPVHGQFPHIKAVDFIRIYCIWRF